ncbi:MAG: Release factor eRF1 PelA [Candidatus Methanohalarchaeum thermophilum]|uniref:Protein pelota homolog n=1 Tax=Methanohalarchaeum thermophilum TaxID=1903181 RepID=A0A1Q6DWZ3_METT1|nr:MAG: Release factor eRF1 PelA [Candidatus Methanohalarchaeum thermophilum]
MKIKERDKDEQRISLIPENEDDFWTLYQVIERGDQVKALTFRSPEDSSDKIRPEEREKEAIKLRIEVQDIEYQDFSGRLRVSGVIKEGKEDYIGRYHTINLEENKDVDIWKNEWKKDQLDRLNSAVKETDKPKTLIVSIEEGKSAISVVKRHGLSEVNEINSGSGKTLGDGVNKRKEFFGRTYSMIKRIVKSKGVDEIILAGPGFTKKDFQKFVKEKNSDISEKIHVEDTSTGGERGIKEAINRGAVQRIWKESRITTESKLIERLLEEIAKEGKATYGKESVKKAIKLGAVKKLLINEKTLKKHREEGIEEIEHIIEETRNKGGKTKIISSEYEPGEKLEALGGIAALLRFKIS